MNNHDLLKNINLTSKELDLYQHLLKSGKSGVQKLSKDLKIPRTTIYQYLEKLIGLNLVKKVNSEYIAENPIRLNTLIHKSRVDIKEKENLLNMLEDEINKFSNEMQNLFFQNDLESGITQTYRGKDEVKKLYLETLVDGEVYIFGDMSKFNKIYPNGFGLEKIAREKNLSRYVFDILIDNPQSRKNLDRTTEYYQVKFLPNDFSLVLGFDFLIYNNIVIMIQLSEDPIAVKIESAPFSLGFKIMHKTIWNLI